MSGSVVGSFRIALFSSRVSFDLLATAAATRISPPIFFSTAKTAGNFMAKLAHKTKFKFEFEPRLTPLDPAIARHTSVDPDRRGVSGLDLRGGDPRRCDLGRTSKQRHRHAEDTAES
jgi:hypothetical protein